MTSIARYVERWRTKQWVERTGIGMGIASGGGRLDDEGVSGENKFTRTGAGCASRGVITGHTWWQGMVEIGYRV